MYTEIEDNFLDYKINETVTIIPSWGGNSIISGKLIYYDDVVMKVKLEPDSADALVYRDKVCVIY